MGWFGITTDKDPKEAAYNGGEKHFKDVIENEGPAELLVWKHPYEDFNIKSVLDVQPGQQAVFINNGVIEAVFENGRHVLETQNIPFISNLRNMFSGGVSTFHCLVYYVRSADSQEIKWGTQEPIAVRDNIWSIDTRLGVQAVYKVRIDNAQKFVTQIVSGGNDLFKTQDELNGYFSGQFSSVIREQISNVLDAWPAELDRIVNKTMTISEKVKPYIEEVISDKYGIKLVQFAVSAINFVDGGSYQEQVTRLRDKQRNAIADKEVMGILGDDWSRQQAANILTNVSVNPGSGGIAAAGAGLGMGMGAGSIFANMSNQMFSPMQPQPQQPVQQGPSGRFTQKPAGAPTPPPVAQTQYFLYIDNQQLGPYDTQGILPYIKMGKMTPETLVWKEGLPNWVAANTLSDLMNLFNQGAAVPPAPPVPPTL